MIELENVSFSYQNSDTLILKNINLHVNKGEFILLVGESGCGKTTLTRCLNVLVPDFYEGKLSGNVVVDGNDTQDITIQEMSHTVGSIFQDPRSQFFTLDTTAEIAFASENAGVSREETIHRIVDSAKVIGVTHLLNKSVFELSSGEKQAVALASVYAHKPKVIVLDEPSANLDQEAIARLFKNLKALKDLRHTIIISEHRVHYLKELIDKVVHIKASGISCVLSGDEFRSKTNMELNESGLRSLHVDHARAHIKKNILAVGDRVLDQKNKMSLIELENVSFHYTKSEPLLQNINLKVYAGEIIGLLGNNGTGKTTLMEVITGLKKQKSGDIYMSHKHTKAKYRIKQTYYVMQDSDYQLFTESVESELFLGEEKTENHYEKGMEVLEMMGLTQYLDRHPASLSGGQKQRLSIAISYMKNSDIICFDEPTSGLDYGAMQRIVKLFKLLAKMGKGIIVATHDIEFTAACCTAVYRM